MLDEEEEEILLFSLQRQVKQAYSYIVVRCNFYMVCTF
jgi:hypothetical protein